MIKGYRIWLKEIIPCVDKHMGAMTFKVMIRKINLKKVVNKLPKIKETTMAVDDCSKNHCYEYEVCRCNAHFNDSNMRCIIALRIGTNIRIVSMMPVLIMTRGRHKFYQGVYRVCIPSLVKNAAELHMSNVKTVLVHHDTCYKYYELRLI
jgi:hypothetical protein